MSSDVPPLLVFCLEELSAKTLLESLLPRLFQDRHFETQFIVFEGKSDMEKKLERRLKGWLRPNSSFVVLRDQDTGNCFGIKQRIVEKCRSAGRDDALVRIACCELESWYLGDLAAVESALEMSTLARHQNSRKFRDPDRLSNAAQELDRLTSGSYQKVGGSREIGKYLNLDLTANRSRSFRIFVKGVLRLVEPQADAIEAES